MASAEDALALLLAPDLAAAEPLAARLGALNRERQQAVAMALGLARPQIDPGQPAIVVAGDFPPGIAGLVAGRLADEHGRPCIVLERGPERCKGSARSPAGLHLAECLGRCADLLIKYGGHAQAAGLTLRTADLSAFVERFHGLVAAALGPEPPPPRWCLDGLISLRAVNWSFAEGLRGLEPYGMGNPEPLFLTRRARVVEVRPLGTSGLALRLSDGAVPVRAALFDWLGPPPATGTLVDVAYSVERRMWDREVRLELRLCDLRPSV
jgi:single-stranded-DNA-specific exonuclease